MTTKVFRGQLVTFVAAPTDYLGAPITPTGIVVLINYPHAGGIASTDSITMVHQLDGTWLANFDTSNSEPGVAFVSIQSSNPTGAFDTKFNIVANQANPGP